MRILYILLLLAVGIQVIVAAKPWYGISSSKIEGIGGKNNVYDFDDEMGDATVDDSKDDTEEDYEDDDEDDYENDDEDDEYDLYSDPPPMPHLFPNGHGQETFYSNPPFMVSPQDWEFTAPMTRTKKIPTERNKVYSNFPFAFLPSFPADSRTPKTQESRPVPMSKTSKTPAERNIVYSNPPDAFTSSFLSVPTSRATGIPEASLSYFTPLYTGSRSGEIPLYSVVPTRPDVQFSNPPIQDQSGSEPNFLPFPQYVGSANGPIPLYSVVPMGWEDPAYSTPSVHKTEEGPTSEDPLPLPQYTGSRAGEVPLYSVVSMPTGPEPEFNPSEENTGDGFYTNPPLEAYALPENAQSHLYQVVPLARSEGLGGWPSPDPRMGNHVHHQQTIYSLPPF